MGQARKSDRDEPAAFKARGADRRAVTSSATLRPSGWYSIEVKICDVSQGGFKAECFEPVGIGTSVALEVPGIGTVQAQVRWQIGTRMGGMFLDPISLNRCEWTAIRTTPPSG